MRIIVRTRSGYEDHIKLDSSQIDGKSLDDVCSEFFNSMELGTLTTLRLGHLILWTSQIESLRFEDD
jgi:hypothetical protein